MSGNDVVDGLVGFWSRITNTSNLFSCAEYPCSRECRKSPTPKTQRRAGSFPHDLQHSYEVIAKPTPRACDPRPPSPPRPRSASPQTARTTSNLPRVNAYDTARSAAGDRMLRCTTTFPSFVPSESFLSPDNRCKGQPDRSHEGGMTPYGPAPPACVLRSASPCRSSARDGRRNSYQACSSTPRAEPRAMISTPYGPAPASQPRDMVHSDATSLSPRPRSRDPSLTQQTVPSASRTMDKVELTNLLDRHVDYYLHQHPESRRRRNIVRISPGVYEVGSRTVTVEWQHDPSRRGPGRLMARDGPLLQPFGDYMEQTDTDASYSSSGLKWSNLEKLPRETRMTFEDIGDTYSRLDAMKVAKEQAHIRERAAQYTFSGHAVPKDLWQKYEKTMDIKLGQRWGSSGRSRVAEQTRPITEPAPQRPTLDAKHALIPEVSRNSKDFRHGRAHSLEPPSHFALEPPSLFGAQPDLLKMVGLMRPEIKGGA